MSWLALLFTGLVVEAWITLAAAMRGFPAQWNGALHALVLALLPWVVVRVGAAHARTRRRALAGFPSRPGILAGVRAAAGALLPSALVLIGVLASGPSAYYDASTRALAGAGVAMPLAITALGAALALGEVALRVGLTGRTLERLELALATLGAGGLFLGGAGMGGPLDVVGAMAWQGGPASWVAPLAEGVTPPVWTRAAGFSLVLLAATLGLARVRLPPREPDPERFPDGVSVAPGLQLSVLDHVLRSLTSRWGVGGAVVLGVLPFMVLEVGRRLAWAAPPRHFLVLAGELVLVGAAVVLSPEWTPGPPRWRRVIGPGGGRGEARRALAVGVLRLQAAGVLFLTGLALGGALDRGAVSLLYVDALALPVGCVGLALAATRVPGVGWAAAGAYVGGLALAALPHLALAPLLTLLLLPGEPAPGDLLASWVVLKGLFLLLTLILGGVVSLVYCEEWAGEALQPGGKAPA